MSSLSSLNQSTESLNSSFTNNNKIKEKIYKKNNNNFISSRNNNINTLNLIETSHYSIHSNTASPLSISVEPYPSNTNTHILRPTSTLSTQIDSDSEEKENSFDSSHFLSLKTFKNIFRNRKNSVSTPDLIPFNNNNNNKFVHSNDLIKISSENLQNIKINNNNNLKRSHNNMLLNRTTESNYISKSVPFSQHHRHDHINSKSSHTLDKFNNKIPIMSTTTAYHHDTNNNKSSHNSELTPQQHFYDASQYIDPNEDTTHSNIIDEKNYILKPSYSIQRTESPIEYSNNTTNNDTTNESPKISIKKSTDSKHHRSSHHHSPREGEILKKDVFLGYRQMSWNWNVLSNNTSIDSKPIHNNNTNNNVINQNSTVNPFSYRYFFIDLPNDFNKNYDPSVKSSDILIDNNNNIIDNNEIENNLNTRHLKNKHKGYLVFYDNYYNENLKKLHLFFAFNSHPTSGAPLVFSKMRLHAYATFLGGYLKEKKDPHGDILNDKTHKTMILSRIQESLPHNIDANDFDDITCFNELVLQLWRHQAQKFFMQKKSLLFDHSIIEYLLRSKNDKIDPIINNRVKIKERINLNERETIDTIDILFIRPPLLSPIGWQLAYDLPNLTIADFPINLFPWDHDKEDSSGIKTSHSHDIKFCDKPEDVIEINSNNSSKYLLDCLDIPIRNYSKKRKKEKKTKSRSHTIIDDEIVPPDEFKNVNPTDLNGSKSSFSNMFRKAHFTSIHISHSSGTKDSKTFDERRSHHSPNSDHNTNSRLTSPTSTSSKGERSIHTSEHLSPIATTTTTSETPTEHKRNFKYVKSSSRSKVIPMDNEATAYYFKRKLKNYKKVALPTQYVNRNPSDAQKGQDETDLQLKKSIQKQKETKEKLEKNDDHVDSTKPNDKDLLLYKNAVFQLRLPFENNSIPTVFIPQLWISLAFSKWKKLIKELFRIIVPGGFVVCYIADVSSTHVSDMSDNKQKIDERDKVLDAVNSNAITKGLRIYPISFLTDAMKEGGFSEIKTTKISIKVGDFTSSMGYLNEFVALMHLDYMIKKLNVELSVKSTSCFEKYVTDNDGKVDKNAGFLKVTFISARKPF